jgi:hypothetical protein
MLEKTIVIKKETSKEDFHIHFTKEKETTMSDNAINVKYVTVLDFMAGEVKIVAYDSDKTKDVLDLLITKLGYSGSNIQWMCTDQININTEPGILDDDSPNHDEE